ncbi:MAG TPA: ATP-binding protein [Methylomirabilota bacterium]|nr:ATP-binding protein [Methylomirabilota bacterium]
MRFGIRSRVTLLITLLTLGVVVGTTASHLAQLSRVVVEEAERQADLIAKQIYAQSQRALVRAAGRRPEEALRRDAELRGFLDSSVGYSPHALYALIADRAGRVLLHSERRLEGTTAPMRPRLGDLRAAGPVYRFEALYQEGKTYEFLLPVTLNREPFGTIRVGVSTTLLRRELNASLRQSLTLAAVALPLAWLVAMALAHLALRPIRAIVGQLGRLERGEFESPAELGTAGEDEFQELSSQLQRLGQRLQADRGPAPGERAHLQHVVEQLEDAVIFLNEEGGVLFYNGVAETLVGRPLEQGVGQPLVELLGADHPLRALVERALTEPDGIRNVTVQLPAGERPREFLVSVLFVRDGGRTTGAIILLKDLESVRTVQSLVSYSAKLAALGRLTSGVAHEVKNPLNAMMIHLELLREKLQEPSPEVKQSLEVIAGEIRRLDRVVQGFLKFMRPQELSFKTLELGALLQSVAALVEAEWEPRGVHFALDCDPALPPIAGDEELLRQAFLNIVQNACQAMPQGGTVTLRTRAEGPERVRAEVADQGVGIPSEDMDKIFRLYYTTKPDGSGIGLALVYRIVQLHDGTIEIDSRVGHGTTVIVRLPVRPGG